MSVNIMATFTEYFQIQALKDRLPFQIDFEIKPTTSEHMEVVAGFEFPVLNDLTSRESWFLEAVESLNGSRTNELQLSLRNLSRKLQKACDLESVSDAVNLLFNPTDELVATESYQQFNDDNDKEIRRLVELFRLAQDSNAINWLRVTFFILSRVRSDWSLGETAGLTNKQIQEIITFISKEANGGILPEPSEEEPNEESEGK